MYSVLQWNCPPAKQALTQCSPTHSSHPSGTTTGRMPCVFVLDTLCLQCSTSSQSQCGSGRHRGQTGRCPFWADGKKELTWDLFSSQRRDKERGKKRKKTRWEREKESNRQTERGSERGRECFSWRESRRGGGQRRVKGGGGGRQHTVLTGPWIYAIDISTHQLIVIALAHKLNTYFTQTEA